MDDIEGRYLIYYQFINIVKKIKTVLFVYVCLVEVLDEIL